MSYPAISLATATVGRYRCPQKRLQTARQPPVYPNSSPRIIAPVTPSPPSAALTPSIPVHRWIRANGRTPGSDPGSGSSSLSPAANVAANAEGVRLVEEAPIPNRGRPERARGFDSSTYRHAGGSSSGKTAAFEADKRGSSPWSPATWGHRLTARMGRFHRLDVGSTPTGPTNAPVQLRWRSGPDAVSGREKVRFLPPAPELSKGP